MWDLDDANTASLDSHRGNLLGVVLEQGLSPGKIGGGEDGAGIVEGKTFKGG